MPSSHSHHQKASKGALIGISVYLIVSALKITAAYFFKSAALHADGLNNLTDIVSSVVLFIGLNFAKQPADQDHHFGHSKYEALASFTTSLIMFAVGIEVIRDAVIRFYNGHYEQPDVRASLIGVLSLLLLGIAYLLIHRLAKETNSLSLKSSSKDLLSDMLTTFATMLAIGFASIGLAWLDILMACIVGAVIIHTAYTIFSESSFELSDGFDQEALENYRALVLQHPKVRAVPHIRGRLCASHIYLDITVEIDGDLSVTESHFITEQIETILAHRYHVQDVDVHVEPYFPS